MLWGSGRPDVWNSAGTSSVTEAPHPPLLVLIYRTCPPLAKPLLSGIRSIIGTLSRGLLPFWPFSWAGSSAMAGAPSRYVHPVTYHAFELPVFQDDQLGCSSRAYRLCGGIVHVGDLATSGHYRPFCVHNAVQSSGSEVSSPNDATTMFGPYTLYDDVKPPSTRNPSSDNLLRHNTYVVFYLCTRRDGRRNSEPGL